MSSFLQEFLPQNYQQASQKSVRIDNEEATLTRYQKNVSDTLGGEHFSTLFDNSGHLKGFVYLDKQLVGGTLVNEQQAEKIADNFLQKYAIDLYKNKELHWIKPHNETITIAGEKKIITGMKVKMRNQKNGLWFWVIVGNNQQPIIFERDIVWLNFKFKRQTEKWLHDEWLRQKDLWH